jgi:flagellar biosynthesis/type III secretory pathway protein FliH
MSDFQRFKPKTIGNTFRTNSFVGPSTADKAGTPFSPSPFMNTHERTDAERATTTPEDAETHQPETQQEAYDLGAQDAKDQLQPQIEQLQQQLELVQPLIQQLLTLRKEALSQAAKDVADIVLLTARRVVGDSLAYNPDALPTLITAAISQMPDEDEITIKVAPDDVPCVRDALEDAYKDRVFASPEIEAGCIIETKFSSIDSSLEAVVAGLEAAVTSWLESENA